MTDQQISSGARSLGAAVIKQAIDDLKASDTHVVDRITARMFLNSPECKDILKALGLGMPRHKKVLDRLLRVEE